MSYSKLRQPFASEEVSNNWAISYGDMITLLLAFFVLFFNIKSEAVSLKLIKNDIDKAFKPVPAERSPASQEGPKKDAGAKAVMPVISSDVKNSLKIKSNLVGERLLIEFPGISFFTSGSANLTKEGKDVLGDFIGALETHKGQFRLVVRGYTDGKPIVRKKKYKDNLELSAFRSLSAIRYLHDQGFPLASMRIAGYGEAKLLSDRKAELARKVVLVIEPLDHTEKQEYVESAPAGEHPLEEVSAAEVPPTEGHFTVSYILSKGHSALSFADTKVSQKWRGVSSQISKNNLYRKILKRQIYQQLREKDYSHREAERMAQQYLRQGDFQ